MTIHTIPPAITASVPLDSLPIRPLFRSDARLAPCVALIGCDGAGKSTLAHDLALLLDHRMPTETVYLGLGTGDLGRRIGRIPVIGAVVERFLTNKASKAHSGGETHKEKRLPGLVAALVIYGLSLVRRRRFRQVLAMRRDGVQVVTDRYPQAELAGGFDGPGLNWTRKGSALVTRLAAHERRLYEDMAAYRPTLVIRLNVDVDTAIARKSDHTRVLLEKKLAVVPTLRFNGAPIVDVDATRPYPEVLQAVLAILQLGQFVPIEQAAA